VKRSGPALAGRRAGTIAGFARIASAISEAAHDFSRTSGCIHPGLAHAMRKANIFLR